MLLPDLTAASWSERDTSDPVNGPHLRFLPPFRPIPSLKDSETSLLQTVTATVPAISRDSMNILLQHTCHFICLHTEAERVEYCPYYNTLNIRMVRIDL